LQVRIKLQVFAAHHVISSAQLTRLLKCLRAETDRGTTMAALWGRVVDRVGIYDSWQELSFDEQRQVWRFHMSTHHVFNPVLPVDPCCA
jgi:hypothetical protein